MVAKSAALALVRFPEEAQYEHGENTWGSQSLYIPVYTGILLFIDAQEWRHQRRHQHGDHNYDLSGLYQFCSSACGLILLL